MKDAPGFVIRPYRTDDLAAIHRINQANTPAVGSETIADLAVIADQSSIALVATSALDDGVVGFCLVLEPGVDYDAMNYRWFSERYDEFVYLDRVAISEGHRGTGLGRRLYTEVERLAAGVRPSADTFTLEVNLVPRNDDSLAFHTRLGFVEVGQQQTRKALVSLMAKPLRSVEPR